MHNKYLIYSAIFFIPLGLIFVYRNVLQGMGESFVPMMAGVYELIARAVVAFTLPKYIGFTGICLADPVAWFAAVIPLADTYYKREKSLLSMKVNKISKKFSGKYLQEVFTIV